VRAALPAGVRHLVFISVVGADRVPIVSAVDRAIFGYYGSKLAAERVVADSGVPWTTLRATQFHDLILMVARQAAKLPVVPTLAGFRFQPVDTGEVAARLVELTLGAPAGLVPDLAGPRVYEMAELLRGYLQARGKHRPLVPVRLPGKAARAPRRREPGPGPRGGPPDLGGVPRRPGRPGKPRQLPPRPCPKARRDRGPVNEPAARRLGRGLVVVSC
jgi:uncharacterized protein YbjT (DUF2867 family)